MTKITIVKNYRGKETLRVTELEEVVRFIQTSAYAEGQFLSRPEYKFESKQSYLCSVKSQERDALRRQKQTG